MAKKLSDLIKKESVVFLKSPDMKDTIEILTNNAFVNKKIENKEMF